MDSVIGGRDDLDRFQRARDVGCAGIEVIVGREQLRRGERPAGLRAAQDATGLAIPSFVLDEHNRGGISSDDPGVAAAAAEDVRIAVAWATELDVGAILVPFFADAEMRGDDAFARTAAAFRKLCPIAAERGVLLAYEGTLPAPQVRMLAERVDSTAFACYFDCANPLVQGLDPPTEIRSLAALIGRVHVKDLISEKDDCRPGEGRVDFRECAAALAEIGYDGWLVLETPAAPPPVVERDVAFTRVAFGLDPPPGSAPV